MVPWKTCLCHASHPGGRFRWPGIMIAAWQQLPGSGSHPNKPLVFFFVHWDAKQYWMVTFGRRNTTSSGGRGGTVHATSACSLPLLLTTSPSRGGPEQHERPEDGGARAPRGGRHTGEEAAELEHLEVRQIRSRPEGERSSSACRREVHRRGGGQARAPEGGSARRREELEDGRARKPRRGPADSLPRSVERPKELGAVDPDELDTAEGGGRRMATGG